MVTLVPLSHVFGQFMALFVPPLLGMTVVFESSANPAEIFRSIKRERATALVAVPQMLEILKAAIKRDLVHRGAGTWFKNAWKAAEGQKFLRRAWIFRRIHRRFGWKYWAFISGGASLGSGTEDFFKRIGYAVVQGYGMTETASLISLNHPFRAAAGSIGTILPGREFRLGEDGEILVRGENVSAGYWEGGSLRPSATSGWLHTGDMGELDSAGNLRFRGRKKNVVVTPAGLNIYPEDLEAALRKQPNVRDCVVAPIEREGNAETCAVLLLNNFDAVDEPELVPGRKGKHGRSESINEEDVARVAITGANSLLAEYQRMRTWIIWHDADFPRTPTGKPRLAVISEYAKNVLGVPSVHSEDASFSANASSGGAVDQLLRKFPGDCTENPRDSDRIKRPLNLSSLQRVELMSALEEKLHVELNETAFSQAETVADVQRLLKQPSVRAGEYSYPRWAQNFAVGWLRMAIYYALAWPATMLLAHPRIIGKENLSHIDSPALLISNHVTRRSDTGLILAALPWRFRHRLATAMSGETLQGMRYPPGDWFFARRWAYESGYWLVTALFNVFPLPQHTGFRESFRFAGESVDRGYSILVFPEGEVTQSGAMASFQSGIGLLAQKLGVPIIPMRLDGLWEMKRDKRRFARRGEITVRIGVPVTFPPGTDPDSIARSLEGLVRAL